MHIMGRQPILDHNEHLYGYELLFRSSDINAADIQDSTQASAKVIIDTLTSFGIRELLGGHKGFINVDLDVLMCESLELLPQEHVILELLETIEPNPVIVQRCLALKEAGFSLALDDHVYNPNFAELYPIVDIIKIDLLATPLESLPTVLEPLRSYPCKLLAEKVESIEIFKFCQDLGFDYFQGYYFARPDMVKKKKMGEDATALLKLLRLLSEDASIQDLDLVFRGSPPLTYKLLMLVNSVAFGTRHKIQGIRHAISMAGRQQIKRWLQLTLFAAENGDIIDQPLIDMAATRAGFMEQLALVHPCLQIDKESADRAYMTGIISLMGSIYDVSIDKIISSLNLNEEVALALLEHKGHYGKLLSIMEVVESLDMKLALEELASIGINPSKIFELQLRAFDWRNFV